MGYTIDDFPDGTVIRLSDSNVDDGAIYDARIAQDTLHYNRLKNKGRERTDCSWPLNRVVILTPKSAVYEIY